MSRQSFRRAHGAKGATTFIDAIVLLALVVGAVRAGEGEAASPEPGTPLRRQVSYSGLFPFYSHERFEDGSARTRGAAGLVRIDREPDGSFRHALIPLYGVSANPSRGERELAIWPLLLLHGRSPGEGYDALGPLARWYRGESQHLLLWPLLHAAREPREEPFRYLPTLYRQGFWADGTIRRRLGVPLLELAEHSRSGKVSAWTILNAFNFAPETEGGLPLARARLHEDGSWSAHLFPLAFAGRGPERRYVYTPLAAWWSAMDGSSGIVLPPALSWLERESEAFRLNVLWPFFRLARDSHSTSTRLFPFYFEDENRERNAGYRFLIPFHGLTWTGDGRRQHYVPLLLAHYYASESGAVSAGALWPLLHYGRDGSDLEVRVLPFLDHRRLGTVEHSGVGILLYRRSIRPDRDLAEHWVLWPLLRRRTSPTRSTAWLLPFFCRDIERSPRREADVTFAAPGLYFEDSRTRTVLSRDEPRFFHEEKRKRILWPFFSDSTTRTWHVDGDPGALPLETPAGVPYLESRMRFVLPPLISWDREIFESDEEPRCGYHLWPLVHLSRSSGSAKVAIVPLLFTGKAPGRGYAYLYPLVAVERGPESEKTFGFLTSFIQWREDDESAHVHLCPLIFKYSRRPEETSVTGLFGSVIYRSSKDGGWFHLLPLGFGMWEGERVSFGVFPFYLRRRHGDEGIRYWNAARLLFLWNDLGSPRERHWSFFWKFMERTSDVEGNRDFRILHRLVVHRNVEGQRELIVNPFFRSFSDARTGEASLDVLKVLYRRDRKGGEEMVRVLGIPLGKRS